MPCPPPPPLGKRTDPDLLLTDKLPQPFRMIQSELYRIVDDAADIGFRNQQEEEERSKQPSTTAERTIGPMAEPAIDARVSTPAADGAPTSAGPSSIGDVALMADFGNCLRPFYARTNGDVFEVAEDSTITDLPRAAEVGESDKVKWLAATYCHGLELVVMLSTNDMLCVWRREVLPEPSSLANTQELQDGEGEYRRSLPKLELKATLKVACIEGKEPFQRCGVSQDGSVISLINSSVVACYMNPVPVANDGAPAEPAAVITGELGGQLCVALSPSQEEMKKREEEQVKLPEVFLLSRPAVSRLGNSESESTVNFALVVWLGTYMFEQHSLMPPLPGEVVEDDQTAKADEPFVRRWMQSGTITACAMRPDMEVLATSLSDGCTTVWETTSGVVKYVLRRHIGAVQHVCLTDTHAVTVGAEDKLLRSYNAQSGELLIEIASPQCGIRHLTALEETPLGLAVTSWGLKLFDLDSGSIFADISTPDPQVVPDNVVPSVAFSEMHLHVMAHRPADPPVYTEGEEPPADGEEPEEVLWRVPLQLDTQRIVAEHNEERRFSAAPLQTDQGPDISQTINAPVQGQFSMTQSTVGSTRSGSLRNTRKSIGGSTQVIGGEKCMPHEPSPCSLPNPEQFDLVSRVREYAGNRHGERRLRDIRLKKRLAAMLEVMKEIEE